jgi:hypothetical protein
MLHCPSSYRPNSSLGRATPGESTSGIGNLPVQLYPALHATNDYAEICRDLVVLSTRSTATLGGKTEINCSILLAQAVHPHARGENDYSADFRRIGENNPLRTNYSIAHTTAQRPRGRRGWRRAPIWSTRDVCEKRLGAHIGAPLQGSTTAHPHSPTPPSIVPRCPRPPLDSPRPSRYTARRGRRPGRPREPSMASLKR